MVSRERTTKGFEAVYSTYTNSVVSDEKKEERMKENETNEIDLQLIRELDKIKDDRFKRMLLEICKLYIKKVPFFELNSEYFPYSKERSTIILYESKRRKQRS